MHPPSILLVPATAFSASNNSASSARGAKRSKTSRTDGETGSGSDGSMLVQYLEELFDLQVSPVPRRLWNHQDGKLRIGAAVDTQLTASIRAQGRAIWTSCLWTMHMTSQRRNLLQLQTGRLDQLCGVPLHTLLSETQMPRQIRERAFSWQSRKSTTCCRRCQPFSSVYHCQMLLLD